MMPATSRRFGLPGLAALAMLLAAAPPLQAAGKSCEALAAEIAAKIQASGVRNFELEIVPAQLVSGDKVVGTCEQGSKKITYVRTSARAPAPAPASAPGPRKP